MHVTTLPGYRRFHRRVEVHHGALVMADSRLIHQDLKARWSWFLDGGTGDVTVVTDFHRGYVDFEELSETHPSPEEYYGV